MQICFHIKEIVDITFICEQVEPGFRFGFSAVQPQDDAGVGGHHHHPGDQHHYHHHHGDQRHQHHPQIIKLLPIDTLFMILILHQTVFRRLDDQTIFRRPDYIYHGTG